MHTANITLEDWSDLAERMTVISRHDSGPALTIVGDHPELGAVVIVQSIDRVVLISELPLRSEFS